MVLRLHAVAADRSRSSNTAIVDKRRLDPPDASRYRSSDPSTAEQPVTLRTSTTGNWSPPPLASALVENNAVVAVYDSGVILLADGIEVWPDDDCNDGPWSLKHHPLTAENRYLMSLGAGRPSVEHIRIGGRLLMAWLAAQLPRSSDTSGNERSPSTPAQTVAAAPILISTAEAARLLDVDRGTLDAMRDRAPKHLPGAPIAMGDGKRRRSWRWDRDRLVEWAEAYHAWVGTRGRKVSKAG